MATLPIEYALKVYRGASFTKSFRWRPDGTTGQDFTGWAGKLYIGRPRRPALIVVDGTNGLELGADGEITVTLPATTTMGLGGVYVYNLDLIAPDGSVTRFLRGRLDAEQDAGPA